MEERSTSNIRQHHHPLRTSSRSFGAIGWWRGGDGGASIAGSAAGGGVASLSANVGSGGEGGNAGDGGAVQLIAGPGTIRTEGKIDNKVTGETDGQSPGIIAQSVGGGGGNGGFAIAGGASFSGGASGGVNVALGGGAGSGGDGGEVFAQIDSTVQTEGDSSNAVLVQSVGGGGGNGGFSVAAGISASGGGAGGISVGLGGSGAGGGKGNQVNAGSSGDISTKGSSSHGFVAQSMGGGGGTGGFNVSERLQVLEFFWWN